MEIWLFEYEFQNKNFGPFKIFGGIKFAKKLLTKYLHFVSVFNQNRNGKTEITSFSKQLVRRSQKNSQSTEIK